jgi:peptidoglycan/xylan/chitin deacetylase (PgdA/CDA1 family)
VNRDYHLPTMSLLPVTRRLALPLLLCLLPGPAQTGCRQERRGARGNTGTPAPRPDAGVAAGEPIVLEWRPVVEAASRASATAWRAGAWLRAELERSLAGLCRLRGWNEGRTTGYRERGWGLTRRIGPGRTRRLVLTFDDGPMAKKTPRILDLLKRRRVKATFFVVGRVIHAGTYRFVRRIVKEGHTLGNHSHHHLVEMHKHPQAAALVEAEFELTQAMVDLALLARSWRDFRALRIRMLGGKQFAFAKAMPEAWPAIRARWQAILQERRPADGQSPYRMIFVRPPGGAPFSTRWRRHHRQQYARVLRKLGLINVMWDEDSGDSDRMLSLAERSNADRLVEAILDGTRRGGVLLMHDRIGLAGLDRALVRLRERKRVVLTDLPSAARDWYGCEPRVLSAVLQLLHALDYRAPEPPSAARPAPARPVARRRRRRRQRRRRAMRPRRRRRPTRRQGLMPRRR